MDENIKQLQTFLEDLEKRYLFPHLADREVNPEVYDLDVRAYCVLAHAAFEQFFEELAEYALREIMAQWESGRLLSKKAVTSLIAIAVHAGTAKLSIEDNEGRPQTVPLHQVSEILRNHEATLSSKLVDNHGASLKYLRALFTPLGMAVDPDPNADSALSRLATSRGAYAHGRTPQRRGFHTYKPLDPEDARNAAKDCLLFCRQLTLEVPSSPPESAYTAEALARSAHLAKFARAVRKLEEIRRTSRPGARLPR